MSYDHVYRKKAKHNLLLDYWLLVTQLLASTC